MANLDSPQWKRAQQTSLWKRTLGSDDEDVKPLRESFLDARKNAAFLLDKIRPDFPYLTIHDITHVDSLWSVADTIIGENYPINPLEGYVLGIAFLIHDAALSYDAVGGKDKLRAKLEWKDAYADGPCDKDEEEFKKECDFTAIRAIHAREAKEILGKTFSSADIPSFHIIKKASYRQSLGEIIGKIAASHHWSIDDIESKLEVQITPSFEVSGPGDWDINEQKLACILRCADAGHIDDGRAPYYIFHSLNINGVSLQHWKSQNRLGIVRPYIKDTSKLLITSTSSFKKEDFAAWNVAYDAVRVFDEELKKSNNLLKTIDKELVFARTGVLGANSKEELAEYIKTDGTWQPCNFGIHTSKIKLLIENLGGRKLYGEKYKLLVVLRELIQNARDAIHARQKLEESFENGKITIRLIEEGDSHFIEVEDNGIGMSMNCINHHLLDFGNSYWKSPLSKSENPGLRSSGFKSVGKFGIGFYSIFMVAKSVTVRTKRYDKATNEARTIEFPTGLTLSPIISSDRMNASVSTIVRFNLKDDVELSFKTSSYEESTISWQEVLPILVAALDSDVFYEEHGKSIKIHTNIYSPFFNRVEWLRSLFLPCPVNIDEIASKLEVLIDENGEQRGLILFPEHFDIIKNNESSITDYRPCIQTIGGLLSSFNFIDTTYGCYLGYLDGRENCLSRNNMILDEPLKRCLQELTKYNYCKNFDEIITHKSLANNYTTLVDYCGLTDYIYNDNLRRLYATLPYYQIEVGTMRCLRFIHHHLFVGVDLGAGICFSNVYKPGLDIFSLFDSTKSNMTLKDVLNDVTIDKEWLDLEKSIRVSNLPASSYEEIIKKFCEYLNVHPFFDGNKRALSVWVNFLLDRRLGQMIDWRKVNKERLVDLMKAPNEMCKYLKPFLSTTYLDEMKSSITT